MSKLNHALVLQMDENNKEFEELTYHNDLLKNEAKFVLDQHEEINKKYILQHEANETLQQKFTLLEESYRSQVTNFENQIQSLVAQH